MANPFPGMDPYLEGSSWHTVHGNLVNQIGVALSPLVRPKYSVRTETRTISVEPDPTERPDHRWPDVSVTSKGRKRKPKLGTVVIDTPLVLDAVIPSPPMEQASLQVWHIASKRLVAAIEVLSPTNKRGSGRHEYEQRRLEMLGSQAHFLEIDLLRVGRRYPVYFALPRVPYFVFLSRANRRGRIEVWPIPLNGPLPTVPVPLLDGDADAPLSLQNALTFICDTFEYDTDID